MAVGHDWESFFTIPSVHDRPSETWLPSTKTNMTERFLSSATSELEFTKKHIASLSGVPGGVSYNRDFALQTEERERKVPISQVSHTEAEKGRPPADHATASCSSSHAFVRVVFGLCNISISMGHRLFLRDRQNPSLQREARQRALLRAAPSSILPARNSTC